jgi:hypothetical protein
VTDAWERWQPALARASAFVQERGAPLERLRARALLGEVPGREVLAFLLEEGSLASDDPETLARAFETLDPLGQLAGPQVERAVATLAGTIDEDGSWGPPGGSLDARIVLTGLLGGFLTKSLMLRPRVRAAIDAFLCRTWDPERVKSGACESIAAYAHWFSLNDSGLSDAALQWCGRELERGFRTRRFDAPATSRVFVLCRAAVLPGTSLTGGELCDALTHEQGEDGGFALCARALGGDPVGAALDGLTAFVRLGGGPSGGKTG